MTLAETVLRTLGFLAWRRDHVCNTLFSGDCLSDFFSEQQIQDRIACRAHNHSHPVDLSCLASPPFLEKRSPNYDHQFPVCLESAKSWSFSPLSVDSSWRVWRCCWTLFTVLVLEHPVRSCIRVLDRRSSHYDVSDTWWCRGVPQNRLLYEVTSSRSSSRSSISCPLEVHLQWSIIYSRRQRMEEFSDCLSHKFLARSHNKRTYDDNDEMKFLGCMFVIIDALIVLRSRSNLSQLDLRVFSQSFVEGVSYFNSLSDNGWSSNTRNR